MKAFNVFLSLILILLIAFGAFFYFGGTLQVRVNRVMADAAEYPEAFASIRDVIATGTAPQLFSADAPESSEGCTLADLNLTLVNRGIFGAEWLTITLNGADGDIAVYSLTGQTGDVPARSTADANLKLITQASADAPRSVTVRYYVFGIKRSVTVAV